MKHLNKLILLLLMLLATKTIASPAEAQSIQKNWEITMEKWTLELRAATTPEARAKAIEHRPDLTKYAKQMWKQIGDSLKEEWTLEPAAWFLRATPSLLTQQANGSSALTFANEIETIRKAVEAYHLDSPKLTPMCMAMATHKDHRSLAILEKVQESHPDKKIQGVAALASAMILKTFGDDARITKKRLTYLRKAIIQSVDVDLGGVTVAKVAKDELYIITYLTKGQIAPDLSGTDVAGRTFKLSDYKGKIIMLLFWNSTMDNADNVMKLTTEIAKKFQDKPFILLGVNNDITETLRKLEANDIVTLKSFSDPTNELSGKFRVGLWPLIYVLDGERKIQYSGAPGSFAELTAEALMSEIKSTP